MFLIESCHKVLIKSIVWYHYLLSLNYYNSMISNVLLDMQVFAGLGKIQIWIALVQNLKIVDLRSISFILDIFQVCIMKKHKDNSLY